jgi:hypothetical protein
MRTEFKSLFKGIDKSKLSKVGKRIVEEIDTPILMDSKESIEVAGNIRTICSWVKRFESSDMPFEIMVNDGLLYVVPTDE